MAVICVRKPLDDPLLRLTAIKRQSKNTVSRPRQYNVTTGSSYHQEITIGKELCCSTDRSIGTSRLLQEDTRS